MAKAMKGWVRVAAGRPPDELAVPKADLDIRVGGGPGPTRVAEVRGERNWGVLPRVWVKLDLGTGESYFRTARAIRGQGGLADYLPRSARLRLEKENGRN